MIEYNIVDSCTSTNAFEVKFKNRKIDLKRAQPALAILGECAAETAVVLLFKIRGHPVSVYASGRMLLKEIKKAEAEALGKELVDALDNGGAVI